MRSVAVILLALTSVCHGYRMFADRIPNGEQVPHPCKPNYLWRGVGHFNVDGGGSRNPFGQDFDIGGRAWTRELCQKDSDGDGRTNGEELGDPNCVWRVGDIPTSSTGLSHPGVCEPIDSARCQQKQLHTGLFRTQQEWMTQSCKSAEFNCSAIHEAGVRQQPARLELTAVPAKETTYICKIFEFEDNANDYHLIATEPIINNSYILHHMVIFGCEDDVQTRSAYPCDMLPDRKCKTIISVWTLGLNGDCYNRNAGVRVGKNGLKKLAIQLHWNNPALIDSYVDSSGLLIHYTPHLRPYDASVLLLGNEHFSIPPRSNLTQVTSHCSASCTTRKIGHTINVFGLSTTCTTWGARCQWSSTGTTL
ncbi:dopamine beta-hydroxylase-like [Pomacea canaliculata]|uniref:dopamine beta-hydroxylase-like n=1 Tax=Pomacea canaliculata TaxID=400727 RepID=UPI000D736BBA|nr:dopamine beta-hydroxylase-like [Pomacea canaliculata]